MFRDVSSASNAQPAALPVSTLSSPFVTTRVARKDATLKSVDADGVVCSHTGPLKVGSQVAFSVAGFGHAFSACAVVASCRVAALGGGEGGATLFQSHLLLDLTVEARVTLQGLMDGKR